MYQLFREDKSSVGIFSPGSLIDFIVGQGVDYASALDAIHQSLTGGGSVRVKGFVAEHVDMTEYIITPLEWYLDNYGNLRADNLTIKQVDHGFVVEYCFDEYFDEGRKGGFDTIEDARFWAWNEHRRRIVHSLTPTNHLRKE